MLKTAYNQLFYIFLFNNFNYGRTGFQPFKIILAATTMSKNTNRITVIDAVRGLAMLGIMMVNFPSINTTAGDESTR